MTPQLALRIAILGVVALAVFGVLFLRLWALQVLSGRQYLQAALDNQLRSVRIEAPRGQILDRNGRVLVTNIPGPPSSSGRPTCRRPTRPARRAAAARRRSMRVPLTQMLSDIRRRGNDPVTPVVVKETA